MKTDYAAHDARYQQLKAEGAAGWDTEEVAGQREHELEWAGFPLRQGLRVLELGCGAGNVAPWFIARGCDFTGIDISPTAVAWANERALTGARFVVGDLTRELPGEYELIIDGHCLHCIIGADRARLLANVHRALVPGGRFFISTMCGPVTSPGLRACFDPVTRCQVVDGIARRFIGDAKSILEEVGTAGFDVARWFIDPRDDADDQDNLWALVTRRG